MSWRAQTSTRSCSAAISPKSRKRSSSSAPSRWPRTRIGPSGIGVPSASRTASARHVDPGGDRQRHAPGEARVDLEQRRLAAGGLLDLDVGDAGQTDPLGHRAPEALERLVVRDARPVTAIPESTLSRSRGTTASTRPSARASTSSECSGPGRCSWTSSVRRAAAPPSSSRSRDQADPARAAARARLDDHGQRRRLPDRSRRRPRARRGHPHDARRSAGAAPTCPGTSRSVVSRRVDQRDARGLELVRERRRRGSSSVSTVGTSTSIACLRHTSMTAARNAGRRRAGASPGGSWPTRYRPAANGSMSAEYTSNGSSAMPRRTEIPAGPPIPVISTRCAVSHPPVSRRRFAASTSSGSA